MRPSRRQVDELRAVSLERGVVKYAEGSCFVKFGDTHVLVTASLEERLPPWLKGQGRGWVTAEYGMLPRATSNARVAKPRAGKQGGRTVEIQRLIGRSLAFGHRSAGAGRTPDHPRLRCDPGRRRHAHRFDHRRMGRACAIASSWMKTRDMIKAEVLRDHIAAVSCGVFKGTAVLDLDYAEDLEADTDANFVMTGSGNIVEIQATAEKTPVQRRPVPRPCWRSRAKASRNSLACKKWR